MRRKKQSDRLSTQQEENKGAVGIFDEGAQKLDKKISDISKQVLEILKKEYPQLKFKHRSFISKKEINTALNQLDKRLGQTLIISRAGIKPDGGLIEVLDDNNNWRIILVSEAKYQGKDIENVRKGIKVGKKKNQDLMAAGNAIERAHKNICEIANRMLTESYFPYVLFITGSNFLTKDVTITRPDGSKYTITYDNSTLNRLDRLTSANYAMPLNTNHCKNIFVSTPKATIMLQAASIYTQGSGEQWKDTEVIKVMLEIAKTSLRELGSDIFTQVTNEKQKSTH